VLKKIFLTVVDEVDVSVNIEVAKVSQDILPKNV